MEKRIIAFLFAIIVISGCHTAFAMEVDPEIDYDHMLLESAENGNLAGVREALLNGADPEASDQFGSTALLIATCKSHHDIMDELLRHGASPDTENNINMSPLLVALFKGNCPRQTFSQLLGKSTQNQQFMTNLFRSTIASTSYTAVLAFLDNKHQLTLCDITRAIITFAQTRNAHRLTRPAYMQLKCKKTRLRLQQKQALTRQENRWLNKHRMEHESRLSTHYRSSRILKALLSSPHIDPEIQTPIILEIARLEQCKPAIENMFEEIAHEQIEKYIADGRRRHPALAAQDNVVKHIQFHEIQGK